MKLEIWFVDRMQEPIFPEPSVTYNINVLILHLGTHFYGHRTDFLVVALEHQLPRMPSVKLPETVSTGTSLRKFTRFFFPCTQF